VTPSKAQLGWSLIVLVWLPMLAVLIWGRGGVLDLIELKKQVRGLEAEVQALEQERDSLKAEVTRLQADPTLYERPARERFFLKKPGETVLYLPQSGQPAPPASTRSAVPAEPPQAAPSQP
jgi:cell division protein FtsB